MTYPTLMVHLELGQTNAGVLKIAADLAERFGSRVVGIASGKAVATVRDVGYMSGDQVEGDLRRLEMETDFAQARFRTAFHASGRRVEWRSKILYGPASDYLANEARCADLSSPAVCRVACWTAPAATMLAGWSFNSDGLSLSFPSRSTP